MKTKKEELSLFNIIWIGFSFIAGITFTASFGQILDTKTGVGIHIYWIFALEGIIAFLCAWSFAKLVQFHPQANGGGGQYARTAFGKFFGLLVGLLNYAVIPVIGMGLMVTMVRANFDNLAGYDTTTNSWGRWGSWGNLWLDLISYGLYMFAASIIFFGIKKYKIVAVMIGYMTWGITVLLIIFGLVSGFIQPLNDSNNTGFLPQSTEIQLGFNNFANTFTTCFFAFAGIETFITTGKNIKERNKNMPIAIIVIMILTTVFYIAFTGVVMFAVRQNSWSSNPNTQIFSGFSTKWLAKFGSTLVIICTMLMRFNSSLQITLFGGSTLEPLASQKFLPDSLKKENKDNLPIGGVIVTIIGFTITFALFILIPDIIQGVHGKPSPFNYATLSSTASILLLSIYIFVILAAITHGLKKNIKVKLWEYIGWFLTLGFIFFILGFYFKGLGETLLNPYVNGVFQIQDFLKVIFQIIYILAIILTAVCVYFISYKKKIAKLSEQELKELKEYEEVYTVIKT